MRAVDAQRAPECGSLRSYGLPGVPVRELPLEELTTFGTTVLHEPPLTIQVLGPNAPPDVIPVSTEGPVNPGSDKATESTRERPSFSGKEELIVSESFVPFGDVHAIPVEGALVGLDASRKKPCQDLHFPAGGAWNWIPTSWLPVKAAKLIQKFLHFKYSSR